MTVLYLTITNTNMTYLIMKLIMNVKNTFIILYDNHSSSIFMPLINLTIT